MVVLILPILATATPARAQPPFQSPPPIVVNAIDNDPGNKLWNCETSRVPFGNEAIDKSRCFTFHYTVPPEGIQSATVHITINTLGSLQDTDATALAVGAPYEPCAWGQGQMPGCVVVHGGFKGGEKSLNLNLLDIACDASVQGSPEAQRLVLDQLHTGVLHMILEDDTAVYSAQLVLNGGSPSFACGTSTSEAQAFIPRQSTGTELGRQVNTWLTGTPTPAPANKTGAAGAAIGGAGLLALLALSNTLAARSRQPTGTSRADAGQLASQSNALPSSQPPTSQAAASIGDLARDQVVDSLPDARDNAVDLIIDATSERDKKRRTDKERQRLEAWVAEKQRLHDQSAAALKQAIDRGSAAGGYEAAHRAWQQAGAELQRARDDLQQFLKSFADKPHNG